VKKPLKPPTLFVLKVYKLFGLVKINEIEDENLIEINNFTLMNLLLLKFGPMHEQTLAILVIFIQILSSCLAFFVRYRLVHFFYEVL